MIGQTIENYRIEELLGQGGMGSVYRATDISLDRAVALKIMNPGVATNADFLRRFKSEARVLGRLQHPNIVNVYTFRHLDSHLIIVMEYVGGGTLSDLIDRSGALGIPKAVDLLKQSLSALEFAHSSNIIHRDIKPPNILLTERHQVKVSDFGLAKIQEDSNATMVTRVGMTGGTLHYMPPEQSEALSNVDHRGDIYSLGMTFYQMLAGRVPFDRNSSAFSILRAIDQQKIPTPDSFNSSIPKELVRIVMKSIKKYPKERYQSAEEMLRAIEKFEAGFGQANEFAKTQILSSVPSIGLRDSPGYGSQDSYSRKQKSSKDKSFSKKKSSSKVKKQKSKPPSKVSKLRGSSVTPDSPWKKAVIPIIGVVLLAIVGVIVVPRLLPSSSIADVEEPGVPPGSERPSQGNENASNTPSSGGTTTEPSNQRQPAGQSTRNSGNTNPSGRTPNPPSTTQRPTQGQQPNRAPASKTVVVRSNPSGATVLLNGRAVGITPLTLADVEPEMQFFQLELDGYEPVSRNLDVARETTVSVNLRPVLGRVRIIVRPYGDIFVNGTQKARQTSLVYREELPVGVHTVRATHPVLGVWEKQVAIQSNRERELIFNFDQEFIVTVASNPSNAEIIVDGEPLMSSRGLPQTTPLQLRLPPGNHTISVKKQGFRVVGGPIDIVLEEDISEALVFVLETL